jgi:hypothetical protein
VKRYETLDEGRIYWVKVETNLSPTLSIWKKKEVDGYYKYWLLFITTVLVCWVYWCLSSCEVWEGLPSVQNMLL